MSTREDTHPLRAVIDRYNDAWNRHDVDAIVALHAPAMVFENHTAGERVEGAGVRAHVAGIFEAWPDLRFRTRRLYVRDDLVVQEWTASATHSRPLHRGDLVAPPTGRLLEWEGLDVIPFEDGLVLRKDVYSDSVAILRATGLLETPALA
ncbi:MAG TPA: nuclear transport factor 2 family protein [Gaiellaceae bacterium]|nr:nuclear transport factor 2 family protein [Gaiellaceae bacterium]